MDKGGPKQSTASHSPAFNTRRRVRGCTMMDSLSSNSKNSSSVVGLTSSLRLSKKSKCTTEEPLKSESQVAGRDYPRFHSSQLNDVIDKILGGNSVTPRETAPKIIPTTKAVPNTDGATSQVSNQTEGFKECNLAAPVLRYMDNQKPPSTIPVSSTDAEQIPLEEGMAASDFVKETERYKEFDVDATFENNNNLDQTGQAPVDCMTAVAEQTTLEEAML
ncbi:hypothetical protein PanWU01x14_072990 [Parasponia andersonii]|uniref:Uncharacterized protein n=1 Tax=Parasponia andersonii TaxID=3476 RepID=A0A2P5DDZ4_PARAD|nr:hypothetical protein PanWU01x14_072990 [Parasponia andersonii]